MPGDPLRRARIAFYSAAVRHGETHPHSRTRHLGADGHRPRRPAWLRLATEAAPGGVMLDHEPMDGTAAPLEDKA